MTESPANSLLNCADYALLLMYVIHEIVTTNMKQA